MSPRMPREPLSKGGKARGQAGSDGVPEADVPPQSEPGEWHFEPGNSVDDGTPPEGRRPGQSNIEPVRFGKYQLLERLARGGMAEVFKAKAFGVEGFEKTLVIKRILPELCSNRRFVDMFVNEAKIAVHLNHANIVQVFDLGREGDSYFIAMEFVAGRDLSSVLENGVRVGLPFPVELAVYIAGEMAKALDYAHRCRDESGHPLHIVHRDVSPQNVLLSDEGEVKLTDFGIAKARTDAFEDLEAGVLKGKYAYMAPEQANGRNVDARADLFALGTVLYEALAGWNPFSRDSSLESLKAVRRGEAPPLRQVNPEVPEALSRIVALAMSPGIESRHPTAGLLYKNLSDFMKSSGVHVTAADLRAHLLKLQASTESDGSRDSRIAYTFSREAEPVVHSGGSATPAEGPTAKSTARKDESTGSGVRGGPLSNEEPGEKREITVLAVLRPLFDQPPESTTRSLIRRFGGHIVEQTTAGDGRWVVVAFGASDPDGRDSDRAARCALRILRAAVAPWDQEPTETLRMAVHTGAAFLDRSGELIKDQRYHAVISAAERLAGRAQQGQILVSKDAEKLLARRFLLQSDNGLSSLLGEVGTEFSAGAFVGRQGEMHQVGEILSRADSGVAQLLMLVGEPGAGKSRILSETAQRLRDGAHRVGFHLVPISRQSRGHPLSSVEETLRTFLSVDELDTPSAIRMKLDQLRALGLSAAEIHCLRSVLGVAVESSVHGVGAQLLRHALSRLVRSVSAESLTVFAFDSAEGIDEESRKVLSGVFRDCADVRAAFLMTTRPGMTDGWSELPSYSSITIGPLSERDVMALTAGHLGVDQIPPELLRDVLTRGRGNPLFMEEILYSLEESGALHVNAGKVQYSADAGMTVALPRSLQGMMEARLGRLATVQRHLLQVAAVVGTRFSSGLLVTVTGEDEERVLDELVRLSGRGILTPDGPDEFKFTHELVASVLVDSLPEHVKRTLHRTVAMALEEQYPKQIEELRPRLAVHWEAAGDVRRAVEQHERCGDRMEAERRFRGALLHLRHAASLARGCASIDREVPLAIYRRVGELAIRSRRVEAGAEALHEALEFAESLGRDDYVARFSMLLGRCLGRSGRVRDGQPFLFRAQAHAEHLGNQELLRDVALASAEGLAWQGRFADAVRPLQKSLADAEEVGDTAVQLRCLLRLAEVEGVVNGPETAFELLTMAQPLISSTSDPSTRSEFLCVDATICLHAGKVEDAIRSAKQALQLAEEAGLDYDSTRASCLLGELEIRRGAQQQAFPYLREGFELARENGYRRLEVECMKLLGFVDAVCFQSAEGKDKIELAIRHAQEAGQAWDEMHGLYFLALAESAMGRKALAKQHLERVVALAMTYHTRPFQQQARSDLLAMHGDAAPVWPRVVR